MNTKLELMYRDQDNYKKSMYVVLAGAISKNQIGVISENLEDGMFVICDQLGLPTPSEKLSADYEFPTGSDHVWTTLADFEDGEPSPEMLHSSDEATIDMTIDDLVSRIKNVSWNVCTEIARLGIPEQVVVIFDGRR